MGGTGGVTRLLLIGGMTLGGAAASVAVTSYQVTNKVDALPNDSYIKKMANQVSLTSTRRCHC